MSAFSSDDILRCKTPSKSESVSEGHTKGQTHYCRVGARLVPPTQVRVKWGPCLVLETLACPKAKAWELGSGKVPDWTWFK